ncbi:hypothetical protein FKM82_004623 [Ascaphus truei]
MYTHTHTHTHTRVCVYIHTRMYIYTYIHKYIYNIYKHTHTYASMSQNFQWLAPIMHTPSNTSSESSALKWTSATPCCTAPMSTPDHQCVGRTLFLRERRQKQRALTLSLPGVQ